MKTRSCVVVLIAGCVLAVSVYAATKEPNEEKAMSKTDAGGEKTVKEKELSFKTELDKTSYAIGVQWGQNFKKESIELNLEMLMRGIKDAMAEKKPALSQDEMQQVLQRFQERIRTQQQERRKAEGAMNLAEGKVFLEANKSKQGVKVLPSGLQYKVIKEGTGKSPAITDKVKTHYRGTFVNGTEFDSSYGRGVPAEFVVSGVIRGWTEALQLMKEGAKWELYVPADLAYGEQGRPGIPPNSTLIFEVELLDVIEGGS